MAPKGLQEGRTQFEGMVVPTKGGFMVFGVVIEDDALPKALDAVRPQNVQRDDWFLGAVVQIDADLQKISNNSPREDGVVEQTRSGTWFQVRQLYTATIVKPAEVIEGELHRSKGFFALQSHLIDRHDLDWALGSGAGEYEGQRVRLYGQPRTVHCEPNAQCLIQGSLPMFDVGRAEKLP